MFCKYPCCQICSRKGVAFGLTFPKPCKPLPAFWANPGRNSGFVLTMALRIQKREPLYARFHGSAANKHTPAIKPFAGRRQPFTSNRQHCTSPCVVSNALLSRSFSTPPFPPLQNAPAQPKRLFALAAVCPGFSLVLFKPYGFLPSRKMFFSIPALRLSVLRRILLLCMQKAPRGPALFSDYHQANARYVIVCRMCRKGPSRCFRSSSACFRQ